MINNVYNFIIERKIEILVVHGLFNTIHTHRFIHEAVYEAFSYIIDYYSLDIKLIWCEDDEFSYNLYNYDKNYLVFSSPHYNTDAFLPVLDNVYYILHYRTHNKITNKLITKYNDLLLNRKAVKYVEYRGGPNKNFDKKNVRYLSNGFFWYYNYIPEEDDIYDLDIKEKENYTYFYQPTNELHMCWATNIFPEDINKNIELVKKGIEYNKQSYFCGTIWNTNKKEVDKWKLLCIQNRLNCIFERENDEEEHQKKVRESLISPAFQGSSQRESDKWFYIPCRILKNISYGSLGITNNPGVRRFFKDYHIIYHEDIEKLFYKSLEYSEIIKNHSEEFIDKMIKVMEFVRDNHTYLNRIDDLVYYGFDLK
tara:strand:+ start:5477 stop:6577 length:1101 start_codon:yes stop_codon:yes gene_type:complete